MIPEFPQSLLWNHVCIFPQVTLENAGHGLHLKEAFRFYRERKEIVRQHQNFFRALSYDDITQCAEAMLNPRALREAVELGEKYFPGLVSPCYLFM